MRETNDAEFVALAREHSALIARIARAHEADPALAEELVQDIHLAVWQALPRFRGQASVRTFVARIAHNRAVDHAARAAREPRRAVLDATVAESSRSPAPSPEAAAIEADLRRRLEIAVRDLPLGMRLAASLALEGFSPAEIADVLGVTPAAAAVRLHRAKAALIQMLADAKS